MVNTRLLISDAEKLGIPAINGLSMLSAQAKRACELFLGQDIEKDPTPEIVKNIEQRLKNIVLVGMPGCGKSTTLRMIAGLEDISDGDLYLDGKRINDIPVTLSISKSAS